MWLIIGDDESYPPSHNVITRCPATTRHHLSRPHQMRGRELCDAVGDPDPPPGQAAEEQKLEYREAINTNNRTTCINIHRVFQACYLAGTCAWLQPVFQEPGASRLIAVVTSIRSTTRSETPSSDCTRSPDEISTIGFSTKN
ncbi:hypothetical protein F511_39478 [Dorcoceras hygrometricum]|uniref:Uncharacterized protein n=1 Tax=Dorcoceras hygrometricum TaxID=472368 RepID=A0A2Z7B2Y5_9LAMI|nr:hypothetical protein F511_39478 [Dorcoceras hygrometricum]